MKNIIFPAFFPLLFLSSAGYGQQGITTQNLTGTWDAADSTSRGTATLQFFDSARYSMEYPQSTSKGHSVEGTYKLEEKDGFALLTMKRKASGKKPDKNPGRWFIKLPHTDTMKMEAARGKLPVWPEAGNNTGTWVRRIFLVTIKGDTLKINFLGQSLILRDTTELAAFINERERVTRLTKFRVVDNNGSEKILFSVLAMIKERGYPWELRMTIAHPGRWD